MERYDLRTENEAVIQAISKYKEYGFQSRKNFVETAVLSYEKKILEGEETDDERMSRVVQNTVEATVEAAVETTLQKLQEAGQIAYREPQKPEANPEKASETKSEMWESEIFA